MSMNAGTIIKFFRKAESKVCTASNVNSMLVIFIYGTVHVRAHHFPSHFRAFQCLRPIVYARENTGVNPCRAPVSFASQEAIGRLGL